MTKYGVINCILAILLVAYLVVALLFTSRWAGAEPVKGLDITVADNTGFVTVADIEHELGNLPATIGSQPRDSVNALAIERAIMALDKIESANCVLLNDGSMRLDVIPLRPVARVFDTNGESFYVNRSGKRMMADQRYTIDVPVISGSFAGGKNPIDFLPVIDFLTQHPDLERFFTEIVYDSRGDIILVPMMRGHVVNIGDTADLANKMDRLRVFYANVPQHKGWEYYDTLSVKFRGQLVAHRAVYERGRQQVLEEEFVEIPDLETVYTASSDSL